MSKVDNAHCKSAIEQLDQMIHCRITFIANQFSKVLQGRMNELKLNSEDVAYTIDKDRAFVERGLYANPTLTISEMVNLLYGVDLELSISVKTVTRANNTGKGLSSQRTKR